MNDKTIELELRAEVSQKNQETLRASLEKIGVLHSHTKRLSIMYFGSIDTKKLDIRTRITNGECEVVVKSGSFGSHDRVEVVQNITPEQFLGFVKIFAQFDFVTKVGERETFNYTLPDNIIASFVFAGSISYIEIEKMSSPGEVKQNNEHLKKVVEQLGLQLLKSEEEFDNLCKRLDEEVDWSFHGSKEEYVKLGELLRRHKK
ncbi:MAG: hypothetical protein AAB537_02655 [Patescibacteria group bacterium]